MKKSLKLKINILLILIIIISTYCFILKYTNNTTQISNNKEIKHIDISKKELHSSNPIFKTFSLTNEEYLDRTKYSSDLFTSILNKYNLKTIFSVKENSKYTAYETSILLEGLEIPNGYKQITLNPDTGENLKLYISLIDTISDNSWNQTLNINIYSNTKPLEFNETNFPEIFELIKAFGKNIDTSLISSDINNILFNNSNDVANELYSITKELKDTSSFVQISIYSEHGIINEG